jgi:hypothetical protein
MVVQKLPLRLGRHFTFKKIDQNFSCASCVEDFES